MDVLQIANLPLTVAALIGICGLCKYWISQVNIQLLQLQINHQDTLKIIAVLQATIDGQIALLEHKIDTVTQRIQRMEDGHDPADGYQ